MVVQNSRDKGSRGGGKQKTRQHMRNGFRRQQQGHSIEKSQLWSIET